MRRTVRLCDADESLALMERAFYSLARTLAAPLRVVGKFLHKYLVDDDIDIVPIVLG